MPEHKLRRARTISREAYGLSREVLTWDNIGDLASCLVSALPRGTPMEVVVPRLEPYLSTTLTHRSLLAITLAAMDAASPSSDPKWQAWVERASRGKAGVVKLEMLALEGPMAGGKLFWEGSRQLLDPVVGSLGFPRRKPPVPSPLELGGASLHILVKDRAISWLGEGPGDRPWNNALRKSRRACQHYADYPCDMCQKGRVSCPWAVRPGDMFRDGDKWKEMGDA